MKQGTEPKAMSLRGQQDNGLTQVLADVLEEVRLSISRDISGADLLHSLLSAPWLRSLLRVYECLLQQKKSVLTPYLPYSSGLSQEVMANLREVTTPTPELLELYRLLGKPHVQALLLTHDTVARRDYDPVLPPLPANLPDDEEAIRIVCLAKNKQPLKPSQSPIPSSNPSQSPLQSLSHTPSTHTLSTHTPSTHSPSTHTPSTHAPSTHTPSTHSPSTHAPSTHVPPDSPPQSSPQSTPSSSSQPAPQTPPPAHSAPQTPKARVRHRWDNLRRFTMEKLATSKILSLTDGCSMDQGGLGGAGVAGLPIAVPVQKCLLVQYDPTGNQLCYQTCELMGTGLTHSAPTVYTPAVIDNVIVDVRSRDTPKPSGSVTPPQKKPRVGKRHPPLRQRSATVPSSPLSPASSTKRKGKPPHLPPVSTHDPISHSQTAPSSPGPLQHSGGVSGGGTPASGVLRQRSLEERRTTSRWGGRKTTTVADLASSAGAGGGVASASATGSAASEEDAKALRLLSEVGATIKQDLKTKEILVARVIHGGLADRSGLLNPGDKLVEVNGRPMRGLEPEQVIRILMNSQGTVMLKLIPNSPQPDSQQATVFVRAMADYTPVLDPTIPCQAAGMAFRKGELLEIVDQTDALWWQARKLHSSATYAGLIPSTTSLKKRLREVWFSEPPRGHTCIRSLNSLDDEDDDWGLIDFKFDETDDDAVEPDELLEEQLENDCTREGIYIAGFRRSIRLWRRRTQSQRRQSCNSCCPSNSHGSLANPYEEVVTFRRNPEDPLRLIALIGPSGVGVNELRKRIIKINPCKFQGAVPHTTRPLKCSEEAGKEYHFISRELFEYMAYNHMFLEYGEFKGHFYGTSVDAIKEVIDSGKVCVIDIEPHSIQSIRTKRLWPFVIFIRPPSLERLRQTRRNAKITTAYQIDRSFREEDFREMEQSSQRLEALYGHFFDRVLVNEDLRETCLQLFNLIQQAQEDPQWIPTAWTLPDEP